MKALPLLLSKFLVVLAFDIDLYRLDLCNSQFETVPYLVNLVP